MIDKSICNILCGPARFAANGSEAALKKKGLRPYASALSSFRGDQKQP